MSSNKRLKMILRSNTQKKSSFEERFCNDLCEVLLQYLPIQDKFRLECVSKQFQKNIFNKQYELIMDYTLKNKLKPSCGRKEIAFNLSGFKSLLKKCPNIRSINLMSLYHSSNKKSFRAEYNKIIELIIKFCNNLNEFEIYVKKLNRKTVRMLCEKLGSKLITLRFLYSDEKFDKNILISMPNIKNLSLNCYMPFSLNNIFEDNQCLIKNMRNLIINVDDTDIELFESVVKCNQNLEILNINLYITDQLLLNLLLTEVSNFKNLKELNLRYFEITNNSIEKSFRLMANKCPKLKKIDFNLCANPENHLIVLEIIDSLKYFKQLKKIHLSLDSDFHLDSPEEQLQISCKIFNVCQQLTHLSIYSNGIDDSFFTDIGTHLPKLQYLFIMNVNITEFTLKELSKLKKIQKLTFYQAISMTKLGDKIVKNMYNKCQKLKSIIFKP